MSVEVGSVWEDNYYFNDPRSTYRLYVKVLSVEDGIVCIQQCAPDGSSLPARRFTRHRRGKAALSFKKGYSVTKTKAARFSIPGRSGFRLVSVNEERAQAASLSDPHNFGIQKGSEGPQL